MKQFKPVIICAAVLIVIALGAFFAMKLIPNAENPENPLIDFSSGDSISVIDRSAKDVLAIEVEGGGIDSFAIDYTPRDGGGSHVAKMRDADPRLIYHELSMQKLADFTASLTALEDLGSGNAADFGLDTPQRRIRITFDDGEQIVLLLGDLTPMADGAYLRREDRENIYIIGSYTVSNFIKSKSDYRDITLFHTIESTESITTATVTLPGKAPVTVVKKSEDEMKPADNTPQSYYKLTSPVKRDTNPDTIENELLEKIISIKALKLVEDLPKDLAQYGLDTPIKLSFKADVNISASLLIGDKAPEGGRYVMLDGVPSVILTAEDVDLGDFSHADIASALLFFFNSEQVKKITYDMNGEPHTFRLEIADNSLKGALDGKEMSGKNPTNLFLRTVRFTISGEAPAVSGKPEIKILATLQGGGRSSSLELYKVSEREYAASIDGGKPVYTVNITEVRELYEAFDLLEKGEDIPDMF